MEFESSLHQAKTYPPPTTHSDTRKHKHTHVHTKPPIKGRKIQYIEEGHEQILPLVWLKALKLFRLLLLDISSSYFVDCRK